MLGPGDVYPSGSNAFSNCPKLKIYVDLSLYDAFVNDSRWSPYKDIIVPTTSMRVAEFEVSGVAYNRNHQKNGSGDPVTQTGSGGKTVYQMHVVGAASDLSSSYNGLAILYNDPGETYAYCTTRVLPEAFMGNTDLYAVRLYDTMSGSTYTSPPAFPQTFRTICSRSARISLSPCCPPRRGETSCVRLYSAR